MTLTELAPSGLRCIDRPELEILQGLAWVWGDTGSGKTTLFEAMPLPGLGRLSFIGNSSGLEQPQQAHTRVIVRHWPFWASTPGFRDHPGRIMVPASPGSASGAHLRGSHLGSDVGEQNLVPVRVIALSKTIPIDAPGSGGLSRARRDEITRVAARGVHGLQNGFHRRPARQVQAGVIYGRRAGRVALGARTGAVSCHTSWPDACAVWAFGFGRTPARRTARLQYPDRARPRCLDRHGRDLLRGQPRARRQILRSLRRSDGAQSYNSFQGTVGHQWTAVPGPGCPGRPAQALSVERDGGIGPQAAAS